MSLLIFLVQFMLLAEGSRACSDTDESCVEWSQNDTADQSLSMLQRKGAKVWNSDQHVEASRIHHDQVAMAGWPDYAPEDPSLLLPSKAPLQTFYMYRAQSDEEYMPTNTNTGSLTGVLWYLLNEIAPYCTSGSATSREEGEFGARRFGITRILRYKVQTRATTPLFARGMNFGSRPSFDHGQQTGGFGTRWRDQAAYNRYGYVVGCNYLGDGPFPVCPSEQGSEENFCPMRFGDRAIWYSVPGKCSLFEVGEKSVACGRDQPGAYCAGEPTGAGNCTFTYEPAGQIDLNELVGIAPRWKSFKDYCADDCREFDNTKSGEALVKRTCGVDFWYDRFSEEKNMERASKVDNLFLKKYPDLPSDSEMLPPKCDFEQTMYFAGIGLDSAFMLGSSRVQPSANLR